MKVAELWTVTGVRRGMCNVVTLPKRANHYFGKAYTDKIRGYKTKKALAMRAFR